MCQFRCQKYTLKGKEDCRLLKSTERSTILHRHSIQLHQELEHYKRCSLRHWPLEVGVRVYTSAFESPTPKVEIEFPLSMKNLKKKTYRRWTGTQNCHVSRQELRWPVFYRVSNSAFYGRLARSSMTKVCCSCTDPAVLELSKTFMWVFFVDET